MTIWAGAKAPAKPTQQKREGLKNGVQQLGIFGILE